MSFLFAGLRIVKLGNMYSSDLKNQYDKFQIITCQNYKISVKETAFKGIVFYL